MLRVHDHQKLKLKKLILLVYDQWSVKYDHVAEKRSFTISRKKVNFPFKDRILSVMIEKSLKIKSCFKAFIYNLSRFSHRNSHIVEINTKKRFQGEISTQKKF